MYIYLHTYIHTHTPISSHHSCLHLPPLTAPTRYVLEQTQVTGCLRRLPAVPNIRYKSPQGTKTSVRAEAGSRGGGCGAAGRTPPQRGARGEGPCRSQMIFETAGTPSRRARRHRPKCARWGCSAVSQILCYPPWPFVLMPPPARLRVGASPPPLSSSARGEGLHPRPWSRACGPGAGGRARRGGGALWAQSWGTNPPCPARKPRERARSSSLFKDKEARQGRLQLQISFTLSAYILLASTHTMKTNLNRTKGRTCKQVFEYILLGALSKECLSSWISGLRKTVMGRSMCPQSREDHFLNHPHPPTVSRLVVSHRLCSAAVLLAVPGRAAAFPAVF